MYFLAPGVATQWGHHSQIEAAWLQRETIQAQASVVCGRARAPVFFEGAALNHWNAQG